MFQKIKKKLSEQYDWGRYGDALSAFNGAIPYRHFLPERDFNNYIKRYAHLSAEPRQDYTSDGMNSLANERVDFIKQKLNGKSHSSVLEIGPGNGHVLQKFKEQGFKRAVALDIVDSLTEEVKKSGVENILSSADNMSIIPDKSFDLVVSWSALEHIPNPQIVFEECLRILKPGGYLFFKFGPLFYSPWGYHQYSTVPAPYLHLLFPEKLLLDYAKDFGKFDGYIPWTSGSTLEEYAFLKRQLPYDFILESYTSGFDKSSLEVILQYPEVFKSKNVSFENFFVDWIEISLWRKP